MSISDPGSGVGESDSGPELNGVPGFPPPSNGRLGPGTKATSVGSEIPAPGTAEAGGADGMPSGTFDVAGGAEGLPGDPAGAPGLPGFDATPPGDSLPPE